MDEKIPGDLHAGLSGYSLNPNSYDLGEGITLSPTYAHLMAHFMMAFAQPPEPGMHHPGPWKACQSGFFFNVTADLSVPLAHLDSLEIAQTIVFLLRLWVNPATRLAALSSHPFALINDMPDNQATVTVFEILPREFPLSAPYPNTETETLDWVKQRWRLTHKLKLESSEFALAVAAIDAGQFLENTALTILSLWSALEALFSPSTSELRFRVSALIAAFLEPPGESRLAVQKHVAALYDKRSAAAHGLPRHDRNDVLDTSNLLRHVALMIIDNKKVPTKRELEAKLFGET